ncbi:MAG TPA: hypothetical protein VNB94_07335 [Mycobacteriales bacterium]|nr:hypothetical protein [Mycobacteriales bacterium]
MSTMGRRRTLGGVLAAVLFAVPGSGSAQPPRREVSGRVLTAEGSPATGVEVRLALNPQSALTPLGLVDTPTAFGAACSPGPSSRCGPTVLTRTDSAGRFTARLDSVDGGDDLDDLAVIAELGEGRLVALRTRASFGVRRALPDLREWSAGVRPIPARGGNTAPADDQLAVGWLPLPKESGRGGNYTVLFSDSSGEVWTFPDKAPGLIVDPRLLEDIDGQVRVDAEASEVYDGDQVDFFYRSAPVRHTGVRGAPPSRGGTCVPASGPCRLADGRAVPHTGDPRTVLALPTAVDVTLVTARGCPTPCQLELSTDGVSWEIVGREFVPLAAVTVDPPVRARFVRATFGGTADLLRAPAELSVWGTAAPAEATDRPAEPADPASSAFADARDAASNAVPVLAVLLLVGLLALRSRRRRGRVQQ